jgi:hypothetical protein
MILMTPMKSLKRLNKPARKDPELHLTPAKRKEDQLANKPRHLRPRKEYLLRKLQ